MQIIDLASVHFMFKLRETVKSKLEERLGSFTLKVKIAVLQY